MLDKLDLSTKAQELRELLGEDVNSPLDIVLLIKTKSYVKKDEFI